MSKRRGGDIVQQSRNRLAPVLGESPHNQRASHTMLVSRILVQSREQRERRVFTSAMHAHILQPLHRRCLSNLLNKRWYRWVIYLPHAHTCCIGLRYL